MFNNNGNDIAATGLQIAAVEYEMRGSEKLAALLILLATRALFFFFSFFFSQRRKRVKIDPLILRRQNGDQFRRISPFASQGRTNNIADFSFVIFRNRNRRGKFSKSKIKNVFCPVNFDDNTMGIL